MRSYRELFRTPEFTPFFLSGSVQTIARTMSGLALGTLVYRATESPLLSAVSMFGSSLVQVLGATFLLSAADRLPPRAALTTLHLLFAAATAALALPGLPVWGILAIVLAKGLVESVGGGVRWGLLNEILSKVGYLLGRSVFNMMTGLMQITGYATGGALVALLSPRVSLMVAAALYVLGAVVVRLGLTRRPPRTTGRPSVTATWRANVLLWSSAPRRQVYLALWIPNGLVVGCESLYVSYAPDSAGTLFACAALGMLAGDVLVGRLLPPRLRPRLGFPLLLILAVPYVPFVLRPPLPLAAVAVTLASVGFGASLVQQERLMALTPDTLAGQALGLDSAGRLTMQGAAAALAGSVAQLTSPASAMTATATGSVAVTLLLMAAARRTERAPATVPERLS
ncbi:integral membrane protein [Streptomyces viridochromogenes DSM 40736]|uniref:Integral membrane protein n=1 Tax=Streptomyces viridochromogenes (strain DSM 40736 / JCM 4977 / BCRC 1201 / Tue 494) TaxID=591159 RepID=D9XH59_STRVT|nr:MFS transporter [Streptomyces viridochromogenes]EFL32852.1 integral membrane protein [Streptomyces viridochromogenes DSM 40736]